MITKRQLLEHYKTRVAIAKVLQITKQAVGNWPMDEPIPEVHELKLRYEIAPHLFGSAAPEKQQSAA